VLVACVVCVSCSINQQATINSDASGTVDSQVHLSPLFLDYLADLAELTGAGGDATHAFDLAAVREGLLVKPGVTVRRLEEPTRGVLVLQLDFQDAQRIFGSNTTLAQAGIISIARNGNRSTLRFHLDRDNFSELGSIVPILHDPLVASLGPQQNERISEGEYLEMMGFVLGDGGPGELRRSTIETRVRVDGRIISQIGGVIEGSEVVFRTPLLSVLLLAQPLDYQIVFE